MRIALLTGGGDAPGLNGIIESTTKSLIALGHEVIGIYDGFEGIFEGRTVSLNADNVQGIHAKAGTILGTSNKCGTLGREDELVAKYKELKVDGLVAAGGDGTFAGLSSVKDTINLIGVPKTIDNDLSGTDITFGYDTACSVVSKAVDSLRATANAHRRIIFVETMGRTAGWIALGGGMASYADAILIPERPYDPDAFLQFLKQKKADGQRGIICVVAEGARAREGEVHVDHVVEDSPQQERFGGIAKYLARWVEEETGEEARHTVLGHLQRGEAPTATDRFLTLTIGTVVAKLVVEQKWGMGVAYRKGIVKPVPLTDFMRAPKLIHDSHRWLKTSQAVGIFV